MGLFMLLKNLLGDLKVETLNYIDDLEISAVVYDSRKICDGCIFVCIKGANFDGHDAIYDVIEKGAGVIVCEKYPEIINPNIVYVKVDDSRRALAVISANYFGNPAKKLKLIGITGTKGKTTTSYQVKSILESAGHKVGLIGTIEIIIGDRHIPSVNTTPESYLLQQYFKEMVDCGTDAVVMEVSSQALKMNRTAGIFFDFGIFTNLSKDHIAPNEHPDMNDYIYSKGLLFKQCRVGIINGDDPFAKEVTKDCICELQTFGFGKGNDYFASDFSLYRDGDVLGSKFKVNGLLEMDVTVPLPGKFNVYNTLTAIAICNQFNAGEKEIQRALLAVKVKGRIEPIRVSDKFTLLIDYAHNALALESLLLTLKEYNPKRLVCLFGCGGNRSKDRRYEMGEVSGRLSDLSVITTDNPRFEDPKAIIDDILVGINKSGGKYVTIENRKEAIRYAISNGQEGDIIVLAGKGHEDYQEIRGVKYPMDERELIKEILQGK